MSDRQCPQTKCKSCGQYSRFGGDCINPLCGDRTNHVCPRDVPRPSELTRLKAECEIAKAALAKEKGE